ncbi:MAG: hypothetical protein LIO86_15165 [Lachnospiraceae bacterium]|nr:hypothetical protein [Lachnospiraceae bacterium]
MRRKWFEDFIRVKDADIELFSGLVAAARGDRSVTEFARACGVSTSTLTRIINQQTAGRTSDELLAQIALNADPGSGVTIVELLKALGRYAVDGAADPRETLAQIAAEHTELFTQDAATSEKKAINTTVPDEAAQKEPELVIDRNPVDSYARYRRLNAYAYALSGLNSTTRASRQAVQESLMSRGFSVGVDRDLTAIKGIRFNCNADFVITTDALAAEGVKRWAFIRLKEKGDKADFGMSYYFGMLYLHDTDELATRVTLYMEDLMTYKMLRSRYYTERITGSFSFMLLDEKEQRIISEYVMNRKNDREPVRLFDEEEWMEAQT